MLNYNNVLTEDKSYSGLQIKEIKPVMKLIIRGKKRDFLSAIGKSLNLLLPTEANTSSRSDKLTALWLSPDEWMIYSNETSSLENNEYEIESNGSLLSYAGEPPYFNLSIYDNLKKGIPITGNLNSNLPLGMFLEKRDKNKDKLMVLTEYEYIGEVELLFKESLKEWILKFTIN